MPTLNYDLSDGAEVAFHEAVDSPLPYLVEHFVRGFETRGYIRTEHVIQGGQRVTIITDPAMDLTVIWQNEEFDRLLQEVRECRLETQSQSA